MRVILLLAFSLLIFSCATTHQSTRYEDDVYYVDNNSYIGYQRNYNDIVYNDPRWYNSSRFGFGVGFSNYYYGSYWNDWYWGNPYGYYNPWNPWNGGLYYNPWRPYGHGYYGFGWSHHHHHHGHHGFYGDNINGGYIVSPRPSVGRSIILNSQPRSSRIDLRTPKRPVTNTPRWESRSIETYPFPSRPIPVRTPQRVNPPRNDRNSVPRTNPRPQQVPNRSKR